MVFCCGPCKAGSAQHAAPRFSRQSLRPRIGPLGHSQNGCEGTSDRSSLPRLFGSSGLASRNPRTVARVSNNALSSLSSRDPPIASVQSLQETKPILNIFDRLGCGVAVFCFFVVDMRIEKTLGMGGDKIRNMVALTRDAGANACVTYVESAPAARLSQKLLEQSRSARPAPWQILQTQAYPKVVRKPDQLTESIDGPIPGEVHRGIATQDRCGP